MKCFLLNKFQISKYPSFSAQHSLLSTLEKWKSAVNNKKVFGALLTDFSKTFDCYHIIFFLAKLNACGFSMIALRLTQNYLSNWKQRTKINTEHTSCKEFLFGVLQGSILGPLLFNIFLCDLFLAISNIELAGYADDNTPYAVGNNIEELIAKLQNTLITKRNQIQTNIILFVVVVKK